MKAELKRLQESTKDGAAKKEQVDKVFKHNLLSFAHTKKSTFLSTYIGQISLGIGCFPFYCFSAAGSDQNTASEGCQRGEGNNC